MMQTQEEAIYLLNWDQFSFYWSQIEECMDKTDFSDYYSKQWLRESVENGTVHVWALTDGVIRLVVFSRVIDYPKGDTLQIFWGYGTSLDKFLEEANDLMDKVAEAMHLERVEIVGRKGWLRKMRRFGFETETYIISRAIRHTRSH